MDCACLQTFFERRVDLEVKTPINLAEMYLGCEGRALPMGPGREPWPGAGQRPAKRKVWVIGLLSNKIRPRNITTRMGGGCGVS